MHDALQQSLETLARQSEAVRAIAIVCAARLVFLLAALWIIVALLQRDEITVAGAVRIVLALACSLLVAMALHAVILDPRPFMVDHTAPLMSVSTDNGFPSDHTLLGAALTATVLWIDRRWLPILAFGTVLVLLGRLAVGAHHTLDVLGSVGIVLAVAMLVSVLPLPANWRLTRLRSAWLWSRR